MKAKEVEAKLNNSKARLNNSRARMAALILKCAENTKSDNYKEICNKNAVDILAGFGRQRNNANAGRYGGHIKCGRSWRPMWN